MNFFKITGMPEIGTDFDDKVIFCIVYNIIEVFFASYYSGKKAPKGRFELPRG